MDSLSPFPPGDKPECGAPAVKNGDSSRTLAAETSGYDDVQIVSSAFATYRNLITANSHKQARSQSNKGHAVALLDTGGGVPDKTYVGTRLVNDTNGNYAGRVDDADAIRTVINGWGQNSGDPSTTGQLSGDGVEVLAVADTTNSTKYVYSGGSWI